MTTTTTLLNGEIQLEVEERRSARSRRDFTRAAEDGRYAGRIARIDRGNGLVSYRGLTEDGEPIAGPGDDLFEASRAEGFDVIKPLIGAGLEELGGLGAVPVATLIDRHSSGFANTLATDHRRGTLTIFGEGSRGRPRALLVHGVLSSSDGAFGSLRNNGGVEALERSFDLWAYSHATLTLSPIDNAIELAKQLAQDAADWRDATLIAHSRGGLVAELLARASLGAASKDAAANYESWAKTLGEPNSVFDLKVDRARSLITKLRELDDHLAALASKGFSVRRIVRAGSPMQGSHMAGKRAQVAIELLASLAATVAGGLSGGTGALAVSWMSSLATGFAKTAYDPDALPGLGQMRRDGELVWLLRQTPKLPVPTVALGSAWREGLGLRLPLGLIELAGRVFHGGRHDLAVGVESMSFSSSRLPEHFLSRIREQRSVTHLEYFFRRSTGDAVDEVLGSALATTIEEDVVKTASVALAIARRAALGEQQVVAEPGAPGAPTLLSCGLELNELFFAGDDTFPDPFHLATHLRQNAHQPGTAFAPPQSVEAFVHPDLLPWVRGLVAALKKLGIDAKNTWTRNPNSAALFSLTGSEGRFDVLRASDPRSGEVLSTLTASLRGEQATGDGPLTVDGASLRDAVLEWARGEASRSFALRTHGSAPPAVEPPGRHDLLFGAFGVAPFELPPANPYEVRVVHGSAHSFLSEGREGSSIARLVVAFHREGDPLSPVVRDYERLGRTGARAAALGRISRLPKAGASVAIPHEKGTLLLVGIDASASGGAGLREPLLGALETWLATRGASDRLKLAVLLPGQAAYERISAEEAIAAVLEVVPRAVERAASTSAVEVSFFERYLDLAIRAAHACRAFGEASSERADAPTWSYLGLREGNGFYAQRPIRAELPGGWARLDVETVGNELRASLSDGRAASTLVTLQWPSTGAPPHLPAVLAATLEAFDGVVLELDEQAAALPWELARLDSGQLGERLAVLRVLDGTARITSAPQVTERTAFVVGNPTGDLAAAAEEASEVERLLRQEHWDVSPRQADRGIRRQLLEGRFGIVHLATHGTASGGGHVLLEGGATFGLGDIGQMRHAPAMLVLSACQAGHVQTATGSLAREALASGVRVFVGGAWDVGDHAARRFMSTFYAALLGGAPLGVATFRARQAARDGGDGLRTWAAFQVYGDPEARLREGRPGLVHERAHAFVHGKEIESFVVTLLGDSQLRGPDARRELLERVREAEEDLATRTFEGAAIAHGALGRALVQLGEHGRAVRHFERAAKRGEVRQDVPHWLHLTRARLRWQAGHWDTANDPAAVLTTLAGALSGGGYPLAAFRAHAFRLFTNPGGTNLRAELRRIVGAVESFETYLWLNQEKTPNEGRVGSGGEGLGRILPELRAARSTMELVSIFDRTFLPRADLLFAGRAFDLFWGQWLVTGDVPWRDLAEHVAARFEAEDSLLPRGESPTRSATISAAPSVRVLEHTARPPEPARGRVQLLPTYEYAGLWVNGIGVTIRYRSQKPTAPAAGAPEHLVLLHGHSSSMSEFDALWSHLTRCHVWSLDFPSNGGSTTVDWLPVARAYNQEMFTTLEFHRDVIATFVKEVIEPKDGTVRLAGGSLGGNTALLAARRLGEPYEWWRDSVAWSPGSAWAVGPDKKMAIGVLHTRASRPWPMSDRPEFMKLVFCDPVSPLCGHKPQPWYWYSDEWRAPWDTGVPAPIEEFVAPDGTRFATDYPTMGMSKGVMIKNAFNAVWHDYSSLRARWHWKVAHEQVAFSHRWFAREFRGRPVRLLAGEHDRFPPAALHEDTRDLARELGVPFTTVPGAGHSLHNEVPGALAKLLLEPIPGE